MYHLKIIIAGASPGIKAISVASWFIKIAKRDSSFNVEVLYPAVAHLSFIDEPKRPRLQQYTKDLIKGWSKTIDAAIKNNLWMKRN